MPLEGLWWAGDMATFTAARDKSRWDWTLMIMIPNWIDEQIFQPVCVQAGAACTTAFDGRPVFGNIMLDTTGCVEITVRVDAPDGGGEATTNGKR